MITAEEILKLKGFKIVSIDRDQTVLKAIEVMLENKIGAIVVEEGGEKIGLWSERDFMRNSLDSTFDINKSKVGDCNLRELHMIPHTAGRVEMEAAFLGLCTRYLFITKEDDILGMISASDLMKAHLNKKRKEVDKLKSYVSMEYYENWSWDAKKR